MAKMLKSLMLIFMVLAMFSCSKDEKNGPSGSDGDETASVVGTWVGDLDEEDYVTTFTLTFSSSGQISYRSVDSDDGYTESGSGTYTISGKKIIVRWVDEYGNDGEDVYTIISLSSKEMVLQLEEDDYGTKVSFKKK